jgi:DNA excision repair protein ERCC-8
MLTKLIGALDLCTDREIRSGHQGEINSLNIDRIESRYLLSGGSDSKICLYDLYSNTSSKESANRIQHISRSSRSQGHKFGVSSVLWYPGDIGAFISTSFDEKMLVWDTERFEVAGSFDLKSKIYDADVHPQNYSTLVACATAQSGLRLCDLTSGKKISPF